VKTTWLATAASVVLIGLAACESTNYACHGECTAPDGGQTSFTDVLSADSQDAASSACLQTMATTLGTPCLTTNGFCNCALQ
jgi:hypothetical protein